MAGSERDEMISKLKWNVINIDFIWFIFVGEEELAAAAAARELALANGGVIDATHLGKNDLSWRHRFIQLHLVALNLVVGYSSARFSTVQTSDFRLDVTVRV